jgi:S-adenosylmethionine:tRNA ribosyltransferase-isomerase
MQPQDLRIEDFTYDLPAERIAAYPLAQRDASKLLVYKKDKIEESIYRHLDQFLPHNSLLVLNDTRVINARLLFEKETGSVIEVFCLAPYKTDIAMAMQATGSIKMECLVGGASKWKPGMVLQKKMETGDTSFQLEAAISDRTPQHFVVELTWQPENLSLVEVLDAAGKVPLPPYIKRDTELADGERYQTVYAHYNGSVAAPTAGLHFTPELFSALEAKNISRHFVTLHVGAGTFQPVKSETAGGHAMHGEWIGVERSLLQTLGSYPQEMITAVGTTSLRTLESLYWMGVKKLTGQNSLDLGQWEAYELAEKYNFSREEALQALLNHLDENNKQQLTGTTHLLMAPGYQLKMVSRLVTNFHQPQSTLLLLVAAVAGDGWKQLYDYALKNDFRFLSYGDGCLIEARI